MHLVDIIYHPSDIGGGGDPYLRPLFGSPYLLPCSYKSVLLWKDPAADLEVHATCDFLSLSSVRPRLLTQHGWIDLDKLPHLNMVTFFRTYRVKNDHVDVTIDADTLELTSGTGMETLQLVRRPGVGLASGLWGKPYDATDEARQLEVIVGEYRLIFSADLQTDERNGLMIHHPKTTDLTTLTGALVRRPF